MRRRRRRRGRVELEPLPPSGARTVPVSTCQSTSVKPWAARNAAASGGVMHSIVAPASGWPGFWMPGWPSARAGRRRRRRPPRSRRPPARRRAPSRSGPRTGLVDGASGQGGRLAGRRARVPRARRAGSRGRGRRRGPSGSPSVVGGVRSPPFDLYNTAAAGILAGPGGWRIVSAAVWHDRRTRRPDGDQRARRTTGRPVDARRRRPARAGVLRHPAGPGRPRPAGRVRDVGAPRLVAQRAHSTRRTSRPRPRRSAATATSQGTDGPLFIGRDPHALSEPAFRDGAARPRRPRRRRPGRRRRRLHADAGHLARDPRPQPRPPGDRLADGIVVTPSHNPPEDGGFKYNPPNGGPADTDVTSWIQDEANRLLEAGLDGVRAGPDRGGARGRTTAHDFVSGYVGDLAVGHRHGRRSAPPGCGSGWTRWAARAWPTGRPSASATAST